MTGGILAIWFDRAPEAAADFETWYQHEHLPERLGVPGFRRGRRYRTVTGSPGFCTIYETDTPEVLTSAAYIARLDDPTPMSRRVMTEIFRNGSRTVCRVAARHGRMRGAWAAALRMSTLPDEPAERVLETLVADPGVARGELWISTGDDTETTESQMRGGGVSIAACLFIETLREADARRALQTVSARFDGECTIQELLCEMTEADLG